MGIGVGVLAGERPQVTDQIALGERRPHVQRTRQPRLGGDAGQQLLHRPGPDDVEHLPPVLGGVGQIAHQCSPPWAMKASYCAAVNSASHSDAFVGFTTIIQPLP